LLSQSKTFVNKHSNVFRSATLQLVTNKE